MDERGFVTPWIVVPVDPSQPLDFRVLCPEKTRLCVARRLCPMCGRKIGRWLYFVGGPLTHRNRVLNDPGMHEACARYALVACPHLSRPNARRSGRELPAGSLADPTAVLEKPDRIGLFKARDQRVVARRLGGKLIPHIEPTPWAAAAWFDATRPLLGQVAQMPEALS